MGVPDSLSCLVRNLYAGQKITEPDMDQLTDSKLEKEYDKPVYFHPAYVNYMQNITCKMLGWINHKLESESPGEISTTSDVQMIPL